MMIDKPHFVVKLHRTFLKVDLKEGLRRDLEQAVEGDHRMQRALSFVFQMFFPRDVHLKDIESVKMAKDGEVKVVIPHAKDLHIPLDPDEAQRFVEKINELIQVEKDRALQEEITGEEKERELESRGKTGITDEETYEHRRIM